MSTVSRSSSSAGPEIVGSSTSGNSSIQVAEASLFAVRRSLLPFFFAVVLFVLPLRDCADLLLFELFFEFFFFELVLLLRFFALESAATVKGATALKQIIAARGIAILKIFTTSKNRISATSRLSMQPHPAARVAGMFYGDSRSICQLPSLWRV